MPRRSSSHGPLRFLPHCSSLLLLTLALAACGEGDSGGEEGPSNDAGDTGSGVGDVGGGDAAGGDAGGPDAPGADTSPSDVGTDAAVPEDATSTDATPPDVGLDAAVPEDTTLTDTTGPEDTTSTDATVSEDTTSTDASVPEDTTSTDATVSEDASGDTEGGIGAPETLTVTRTLQDRVRLTWDAVPGATSYIVFRAPIQDGERPGMGTVLPELATVDGTSYEDFEAAAGPTALSPTSLSVQASGTGVTISWLQPRRSELELPNRYVYGVAAVGPDGRGPEIRSDGWRAERPPLGYGVSIDDGFPQAISPSQSEITGRWSWTDTTGAAPTLVIGGMTATRGTREDGVKLVLEGLEPRAGASRRYRIFVAGDRGYGPASDEVTGARAFEGPISWTWLRSSGPTPTALESFSTAEGPELVDTDAPADGEVRWYSIRLQSPRAATVELSAPVIGYRGFPVYAGIRCDPSVPFGGVCPEDTWCAPDAPEGHRFCAPYLDFGDDVEPAAFRYVPAGTYTMGTPEGSFGYQGVERQYEVAIRRPFWMMETELTNTHWSNIAALWNLRGGNPQIGTSPSYAGRPGFCESPDCPVERVSLVDAMQFANAMSAIAGLQSCYELSSCTGTPGSGCSDITIACSDNTVYRCGSIRYVGPSCNGYRLPTEAEWEYAARAGTTTNTWAGEVTELCDPLFDNLAHTFCSRRGMAIPTRGTRDGSPWGFWDILGNVSEWTVDLAYCFHPNGMPDPICSTLTNPPMFETRVIKGGGFMNEGDKLRSGARQSVMTQARDRSVGIRLVRTVSPDPVP